METRLDRLIRICERSIERRRLDRAWSILERFRGAATNPAEMLRIADVAAALGEARDEAGNVPGAVEAYRLAISQARLAGKESSESNCRLAMCAERLCSLFRYRLNASRMASIFRDTAGQSSLSAEQADRAARRFERLMPESGDELVSYWRRPVSGATIEAFELAASVYHELNDIDPERAYIKAADIREELATKLYDSNDPNQLAAAAKAAEFAAMMWDIIARHEPPLKPRAFRCCALLCSIRMKLQEWEKVEEAVGLWGVLADRARAEGEAIPMDEDVFFSNVLAYAYQRRNQDSEAIAVLQDLLGRCREQASDPAVVAGVLRTLGLMRLHATKIEPALKALEESLQIWRVLAARNRDTYGGDLAETARNIAMIFDHLEGMSAEAEQLRAEAARFDKPKDRVN